MGGLTGKRILITRASGQMESITKRVLRRGGIPVTFPCMAVVCLADPVRRAINLLEGDGAQALFTSVNGVHCVAAVLGDAFISAFQSVAVIAVGRYTADALEALGVPVAWVSPVASQEGLMNAYRQRGRPGRLVFFRAEQGRDILSETLKEAGVDVHLVSAYRTICPADDASNVIQSLENREIDAVLLGSARTAQHYVRRIADSHLANRPVIAVISRQVANGTRAIDLDVQVVAKEASFASMLDGLEAWFRESC